MGERMYRAQILLEPAQHKALAMIAKQEERSISDVVREIIRDGLARREGKLVWKQRMEAAAQLRRIREEIKEKYGVYQGDLLAESREEREETIDRAMGDGE